MIQPSDQPLVSCIIAVLNGEAYLREAIDSLLAQTYPAVQIIVVNDGSTDRTADVVARFGDRVRLLNQENRGVSIARNRGVEMSSGQLLCFLDADDLLEPNKIALQVAQFQANPLVQFCDCHTSYFWTPEMSESEREADFRYSQPFWRTPLPSHISTWLFRREVWDRVGGFSGGQCYAEDVDWFSRGRDLGFPRLTMPDVLTRRRLHANNVTKHSPAKQISDLANTLKAHLGAQANQEGGVIRNRHTIFAPDPPLADTLRLLMPDAPTALLLQAALLRGDAVASAWLQWRQITPDPKSFLASDRVGIKRHLPLLYRNLTTHNVDLGRNIEPYFRAARAREELRSARYRRFLGEALDALYKSGIEFIVGKGVTVGETIHDDPVVRHCHDIDLLVRSADIPAAAAALRSAKFTPPLNHSPRSEPRFDHESGLPVELHDRLYRTPFYSGDLAGIWSRAREGNVAGIPVRVLGDSDLLVHALVHASVVPQRCGLSWIVDVVSLLQQRDIEAAQIDWPALTRIAGESRATLPMYVMCNYLRRMFGATIPQDAIAELRRSAMKAGPLQDLAALEGIRADLRHRRMHAILDASGWRSRLAIARAMLVPPPAYLKARHPDISAMRRSTLYFTRPLRFMTRQARKIRNRLRDRLLTNHSVAAILPGDRPQPQGGH